MSSLSKSIKRHLCTAVLVTTSFALVQIFANGANAQEDIEGLFSGEEETPAPAPSLESPPSAAPEESPKPQPPANLKNVTDLSKLETFKDVVVIQRRYLPKTSRFEFFGGLSLVLNDAFFNNFGLNGRAGYYFQERYGVEFVSWILTGAERSVISDLRKRTVETSAFVSPKSYFGVDFKWAPIYGKMTWRNYKITPFDMYFSGGVGMMGTNQGRSELALHLGTGQIFAKTKSMAFRWDISWTMYNSKTDIDPNAPAALYHTVSLQIGASLFYPEATYR